ncbi:hypothetical protein R69749_08506 [Paraburkholderia domus]|nr:hypothetical protein R69749_08506 [Paraburkholderia domus]
MPADEARREIAGWVIGSGGLRAGGRDMQQLAYLREILPPHGIGEQAIVADAVEAAGQHVQQEAAHELVRAQGHGLVAGAPLRAIVLPAEGHAAFIERNEPLVGDGHAMRVA